MIINVWLKRSRVFGRDWLIDWICHWGLLYFFFFFRFASHINLVIFGVLSRWLIGGRWDWDSRYDYYYYLWRLSVKGDKKSNFELKETKIIKLNDFQSMENENQKPCRVDCVRLFVSYNCNIESINCMPTINFAMNLNIYVKRR